MMPNVTKIINLRQQCALRQNIDARHMWRLRGMRITAAMLLETPGSGEAECPVDKIMTTRISKSGAALKEKDDKMNIMN